ncbi:MAG: Hsp20 family protein [Acidobacteria bacterium]|nr:Hsp20 family protein [Acidobacteriota bacterium]MCB9399689.1 Hsp20 family protein [Acidobacteriota bacterium]
MTQAELIQEKEAQKTEMKEKVRGPVYRPLTDWSVAADHYTVRLSLPGVRQEDLNLTVKGNLLTVQAVSQFTRPEEKVLVHEFELGSFTTTLSLPEDVDSEQIKADLTNGLLSLTLYKRKEALPRKIEIQTSK